MSMSGPAVPWWSQAPEFYKQYVAEVQSIIDTNARLEFLAINKEHERTGAWSCVSEHSLSAFPAPHP